MHDKRETTPFIDAVAKHYNECTPKEQRALDRKLAQEKAKCIASPHALYHLFPTLGAKTLKLKEPVMQVGEAK